MTLLREETPSIGTSPLDVEALIEEARRLRRRRWVIGSSLVLLTCLVAGLVLGIGGSSTPRSKTVGHVPTGRPSPTVNLRAFAHEGELAFISRSTLWEIDGSTGTLRALPSVSGFHPSSPEISPDGRWLAYLETQANPSNNLARNELWIADANGTDAHELRVASVGGLYGWEPAHDVLALPIEGKTVGNTAGIDLVSPSGTVRRLVTFPTSPPLASQEWVEGAVWSPDGSQLAVSFDDHVFTNGSTTLVAYSVNGGRPTTWLWLKGSNTTLLGMRYVFAFPAGWWEKWGIGFWVTGGGATHNIDQTPLAVIAKPGAAAKVIGQTLSDDPDEALAAGPSGQLAIVDNPTNFSGRLLAENKVLEVCDPKTTTCTPVRASNSIVTSEPAWSPSGDALAFTEAPSTELIDQLGQPGVAAWYAEHKLYVYRPATHSLQGIANASGATAPTWSWNGKSILYVSNDGLWLLPTLSQRPVKIASPLFPPDNWSSYFAQVDWVGHFSWSSR